MTYGRRITPAPGTAEHAARITEHEKEKERQAREGLGLSVDDLRMIAAALDDLGDAMPTVVIERVEMLDGRFVAELYRREKVIGQEGAGTNKTTYQYVIKALHPKAPTV